jgi:hypothetical protein
VTTCGKSSAINRSRGSASNDGKRITVCPDTF